MHTDRDIALHCARVYLAESARRTRTHRGFAFTLLDWAARCRRRASGLPRQREMFG